MFTDACCWLIGSGGGGILHWKCYAFPFKFYIASQLIWSRMDAKDFLYLQVIVWICSYAHAVHSFGLVRWSFRFWINWKRKSCILGCWNDMLLFTCLKRQSSSRVLEESSLKRSFESSSAKQCVYSVYCNYGMPCPFIIPLSLLLGVLALQVTKRD